MQLLSLEWQTRKARHVYSRPRAEDQPLRTELFSLDQLARHAASLAESHHVVNRRGSNRLLARLSRNEDVLRTFNRSTLAVNPTQRITPAAEWLLDNFYLIEEQIQMAKRHLPRVYSRELPRLADGPSARLPRTYDIVLELISHVDAQIGEEPLKTFIAGYQTKAALNLGELWAIPIMLRLALIENLQRVTTRLILAGEDRDLAEQWVNRLRAVTEKNPSHLVVVVADLAKSDPPLSSSFVAEFCQRLSLHSQVLHLARNWLEQRLAEQGLSIEQLIQAESQNQAADQVSVSHSIGSLRFLDAMDWKEFVESLSAVEKTLRRDPADVYAAMDFDTRDSYRHAVEFFARYSGVDEEEVARTAIRISEEAAAIKGRGNRASHVGFYLIDKGRRQLARVIHMRWPRAMLPERLVLRFPLLFYVGGIGALTSLGTLKFIQMAPSWGMQGATLAFFALTFLFCAGQMAVALMNWASTLLAKPHRLPRLDTTSGLAADCRTMVVIPSMLTSDEGVAKLIEILEIHYLANRDPLLHFALLTDFGDAAEASLPQDNELLRHARVGIETLNRKYAADRKDIFFLFNRPRRWNAHEGVWMGYERKRGKLMEFVALLRGGSPDCFSEIVGQTEMLPSVKYLITLDSDTQLPRDAARQLVGAMAHPLNRPVFDEKRGVVVDGYGILQPRLGISLPSSRKSLFVRLFAGDTGIDPYTREVSDVYQDVFHEGSFIGKGIFDVDAFHKAIDGHFPENTILSHDLLESCHARSGLVSDVTLYEDFPSRYNIDISRRHRWIRGDWQIARWLRSQVCRADGHFAPNPLSLLSQWKIFDNLRRSLVPVAQTGLVVGAWILLPRFSEIGLVLVFAFIAFPGLLSMLLVAMGKQSELPWSMHVTGVVAECGRLLGQMILALAFLPYHAFISLDAICRTGVRLLVTRRRLLEWQTSSDAERTLTMHVFGFYSAMWVAPTLAVACAVYLGAANPDHVGAALPLLCLWMASPLIAWWISRPIQNRLPDLTAAQSMFLRRTARRTWHFFETFVTAEENWLPPDNFQEVPEPKIASRTSPTNIGLSLLANLSACDLGYCSTGDFIRRTENTFATLQRLERYNGHFYNWYETQTLRPLLPLYVSSVDSGNLAGHLLTLGSGLREHALDMTFSPRIFKGIRDTAGVLNELVHGNAALTKLDKDLTQETSNLQEVHALLHRVTEKAKQLSIDFADGNEAVGEWAQTLKRTCEDLLADLLYMTPWLTLPPPERGAVLPNDAKGHLPPAASRIQERLAHLTPDFTLRKIMKLERTLGPVVQEALRDLDALPGESTEDERRYFTELAALLLTASERARDRQTALMSMAKQCDTLAAMDFTFLYDDVRDLFPTGYNVTEHRMDGSFYDMLASEARLCSYVAIALGQIPQNHWFSLGRLLVASRGNPILVSWSGSMFEYLMPQLVMPSYENTLLDHTCDEAVRQQIEYGKLRGIPWGISESGYYWTDIQMNYQYRAFGVPGLGLKRGLAEDRVVAPYATIMALMIAPQKACENLLRLVAAGCAGEYGFYEAADYTPARMPPGETKAIVRSYMAHHQGMSLLALNSLLSDHPMQRRFMECPQLKAAGLLLQERVPKTAASVSPEGSAPEALRKVADECVMRVITHPSQRGVPDVHLLSNGTYHVMVTSTGGGYSRWRNLAVTRWREDATRDCWGTFIYVRDLASGEFWSTGYQPTLRKAKGYEAIFTQARAEFRQRHMGLDIHTEMCVSPEDDVELRRIKISNRTPDERVIELTSYAEVVLAPHAADLAHPAFSNLFVQTEFNPTSSSILCSRRPRSHEEKPPWLLHLMVSPDGGQGEVSCETDRAQFIGRAGTLESPAAMQRASSLSNTVGSVLDPIIALRRTVTVPAHGSATVNIALGVAETREIALAHVEKYQSPRMADRACDLAWTHSQVTLQQLNATQAEALLYGQMSGALIYADPSRRSTPNVIASNRRGQSGLWSYGISGDAPIVLLRISDTEKIELVRQLVRAHSYWRMKGLAVELVILNEDVSVYQQSLHEQILGLIASGIEAQMLDKPGGIFVRRLEQIPADDRILLQTAARIVLDDEKGTFAQQLEHQNVLERPVPTLEPTRPNSDDLPAPLAARDLIFKNGLGGFTPDGREYVITLQPGQTTPMPWVNVIANPTFGTLVSESGSAYTWLENAHEFRLTPWNNDPVQDASGEVFYIRDELTGQFWTPTPLPVRSTCPTVIRHGFGYTVFEHTENGIVSELWIYVAMDAPVKFAVLKTRNISGRARRLSVTGYCEWVLGDLRSNSLLHVQTEVDLRSGALLARNNYNTEFPGRAAFIDINDASRTLTGDRREFIGQNGSLANPAAMKRQRLSGKVGAGLDPCGAVQLAFNLHDGEERITKFRIGVGRNSTDIHNLIQRFRRAEACHIALEGLWGYWNRTLSAVQVETPDPALNVMVNGWLMYQTLACRLWGRTGFYQSGGAYGFRDQLQDTMSLVHAEPALIREHLLRAAARQFTEGDVQHWWHPPTGRGVRTHFSDDFLWLPYATCRYVSCVGDTGVLNEKIAFLEARHVKPDEEAYYDLPIRSEASGTLYEHCVRAIDNGLKFGAHGLPLIGCGDWNDGMNRVGKQGRGESVWLAFFLYDVLTRFSELARLFNDPPFSERCLAEARKLQLNLEQNGWDGQWYRRAYFDNGEPLGSQTNTECQIDFIPQSWAALSGAGDKSRVRQAMESAYRRLVKKDEGLIQLFAPPFDKSELDPGYIKGYIPGVRENGGQYTHSAVWAAMAFAHLDDHETAWDLLALLNPVHHGDSPEKIATYKVEPYVLAADVYGVAPHTGRGGWTWYTGAAGWMYRLMTESLLGIHLNGERLLLTPHMPKDWTSFKISYRYRQTSYDITVTGPQTDAPSENQLSLDGLEIAGPAIPLVDDQKPHVVTLRLAAQPVTGTNAS